MYVVKRDGTKQNISFDKITARLETLCTSIEPRLDIDCSKITQNVIGEIVPGITTERLDLLSAEYCASNLMAHPDMSSLASRIVISNLHKQTMPSFTEAMILAYTNVDKHGKHHPLISDEFYDLVVKHEIELDAMIIDVNDFKYDYFGIQTLIKNSYLLKDIEGNPIERPQYALLRVALFLVGDVSIEKVHEVYNMYSNMYATPATPTYFNAGTNLTQMASCFLLTMDDSLSDIFDVIKNIAMISKTSGGIGVDITRVRPSGTIIKSTNGVSDGIIPMLRVINDVIRYVNQGGGKRKGACAIYLEPWHGDVREFLQIRKNTGNENERCRDLQTALWVPDLFMKRVQEDKLWSLMSPKECPGLTECWGGEFEALYTKYESDGCFMEQIPARKLWTEIIDAQIESGTPYLVYKDSCNGKSNQKNIGMIRSSNLCTEIVEVSNNDEYGVCNLASISLTAHVTNGTIDYEKLTKTSALLTEVLNEVIDKNSYPVEETEKNLVHRPIGIGIQGLADTFAILGHPFTSDPAKRINKNIAEAIYYGAMRKSCDIAKDQGAYDTFDGSPASKGIFQFDMWDGTKLSEDLNFPWDALKEDVSNYGLRNSLVTAYMPTASTSQILGNMECFEPFTSNLYFRRTLAGVFTVVNKYLVKELYKEGLLTPEIKEKILFYKGSIQHIQEIPQRIRDMFKTVREWETKDLIDMVLDRAPFVCQSQSMNLYVKKNASIGSLSAMHFYGWKRGIKTGSYYMTAEPESAIDFTIDPNNVKKLSAEVCIPRQAEDGTMVCDSCSA